MATRHQARTAVVGLLYAYDLGNENIANFSDEILEEGKIRNKQREFSNTLFEGTIENLKMIDEEIEKHLTDWDYDAIGKVEKAIMRLGAYEILVAKTDRAIIINEAVELAKKLADEKSPQFINGVLDALGKPVAESKSVEVAVEEEVEVVEVTETAASEPETATVESKTPVAVPETSEVKEKEEE